MSILQSALLNGPIMGVSHLFTFVWLFALFLYLSRPAKRYRTSLYLNLLPKILLALALIHFLSHLCTRSLESLNGGYSDPDLYHYDNLRYAAGSLYTALLAILFITGDALTRHYYPPEKNAPTPPRPLNF